MLILGRVEIGKAFWKKGKSRKSKKRCLPVGDKPHAPLVAPTAVCDFKPSKPSSRGGCRKSVAESVDVFSTKSWTPSKVKETLIVNGCARGFLVLYAVVCRRVLLTAAAAAAVVDPGLGRLTDNNLLTCNFFLNWDNPPTTHQFVDLWVFTTTQKNRNPPENTRSCIFCWHTFGTTLFNSLLASQVVDLPARTDTWQPGAASAFCLRLPISRGQSKNVRNMLTA